MVEWVEEEGGREYTGGGEVVVGTKTTRMVVM